MFRFAKDGMKMRWRMLNPFRVRGCVLTL